MGNDKRESELPRAVSVGDGQRALAPAARVGIIRGSNWIERAKERLRATLPKEVAYASYFRALFENEIELRLLSSLCQPESTSVDVGAFTGIYSLGLSIHSKNVIAVEPQHARAEALQRSMPGNVAVVEAALSDRSGTGFLRSPSAEGSSMARLDGGWPGTENWLEFPVTLMRLDDLTLQRVGFVKVDAEGHETEILRGASRILELDKPSVLVEAEEQHSRGAIGRLVQYLGGLDYVGYFVYRGKLLEIREFDADRHQNVRLLSGGTRRTYADYVNNFIFVHRSRVRPLPHKVPSAAVAALEAVVAAGRKISAPPGQE